MGNRPSHRWIAGLAALFSGAVMTIATSCGGTAVFDSPDPKACGTGHGCPMVGCTCADDSVVFDTTCELGECRSSEEVCDERCADFGGPLGGIVESVDDEVPVPDCQTFCTRLLVNGCELGCDTLFSNCLKPSSCSAAAGQFWQCATNEAVITCDDNAVRIEGCDASSLAICDK